MNTEEEEGQQNIGIRRDEKMLHLIIAAITGVIITTYHYTSIISL